MNADLQLRAIAGIVRVVDVDLWLRGGWAMDFFLGRDADGCPTVPAGPYAGACWPADLLDGPPGRIGDITCPIVSPRAQIEIKEMMPVRVPGLPLRAKDCADISQLRAALT